MEHTKILTAAARKALRPHGLVQKGRSRIWIADHGWWLAVVEFQPSSWSRGSYLNVGAMWLTYPVDHLVFNDGHREHAFESFKDSDQFREVAAVLARLAAEKVEELRSRLATISDAYRRLEVLLAEQRVRQIWSLFHTASFAALTGDTVRAASLAQEIASAQEAHDWVGELKRIAAATFLGDSPAAAVKANISATRERLKLAHVELANLDAVA